MSWPGAVWICGGQRIYEEALALSNSLYITRIHRDFEGDRVFPAHWPSHFRRRLWHRDESEADINYTFEIWLRQ